METIKRGTKEHTAVLSNATGATLFTGQGAGEPCAVSAVRAALAEFSRAKLEYVSGEFHVRIDKRRRFVLTFPLIETPDA